MSRQLKRIAGLLLLAAVVVAGGAGAAEPPPIAGSSQPSCAGLHLEVDPANPLESTPVTVTISAGCADTCPVVCDVVGEWAGPSDFHIDWYIRDRSGTPDLACLQAAIIRSSDLGLGDLAAGEYNVTATMHITDWESACREGMAVEQTQTAFRVYALLKNRFISFLLPDAEQGTRWAIRVKLVKLYNSDPDDPDNEVCAPRSEELPDLSVFEGQVRWVGPPESLPETSDGPTPDEDRFVGAALQCCPHFTDWNADLTALADELLHVYGAEIVPCSKYEVQLVDNGCPDLTDESCYS